LIYLSKIPVGFLYRSLKSIWLIVAVTYLFHLIFTRHGDIMWSLGPITLYEGGVVDGAIWTIRIVLLAALASLITMTTPPLLLTRGLARLMSPLKRLKVPVDELALATSSALAFIPLLWREADQLIRAQRSRGAPFDRGSVWSRAKAYQAVLIPLFISAIRRAEAMAMAMEVRGYRGESGRTQFRPLKLKRSDYLILFLLLGYVLLLIFRGIG
jgi:energy-coupling factor transport system permease protein